MAGANRPPRAQPLPIIDLVRCNGCGLCVSAGLLVANAALGVVVLLVSGILAGLAVAP